MTTDPAHVARVHTIVSRVAGPTRTPTHSSSDTPLGEDGFWLDSIGMLEVLVVCEEEFKIAFDWQTELTRESLSTVRSLADLILKKTA